jgi:hypothetical protein
LERIIDAKQKLLLVYSRAMASLIGFIEVWNNVKQDITSERYKN